MSTHRPGPSFAPSFAFAALIVLILSSSPAALPGQAPPAAPETEAYLGQPLGVGRARFAVENPNSAAGVPRFNLAGDHARILYPVFYPDPVPVGPAGPAGTPPGFEVIFLFRGVEPLKLNTSTNLDANRYREFKADVAPLADAGAGRRDALLRRWWSGYRALLEAARARDDHYPVIENYLAWRLPRLLGPAAAPEAAGAAGSAARPLTVRPLQAAPEIERLADLLIGTESIRIAMQEETLLSSSAAAGEEAATAPLPPPVEILAVELPAIPAGVAVEPIAAVVPAECLYIRFPRFSAYRSLRGRAESLGAIFHDLLLGRALDARVRETVETQLSLRETALSRLFGDLVIGEMALVAHDTFIREGSALGVVFEVKNEPLFLEALGRLRRETIEASRAWPTGAAEEREIEIGGARVKHLQAPGNRVRSFHAVSGRHHLVSNCRRLVERFLECGADPKENRSLAADPGFRHGRTLHPLSAGEDALVFISDPFIRELIGPAYRAEMTRRTRARAELELIETARLAARAETGREHALDELVAAAYLPQGILRHPDGATYRDGPEGAEDTRRGARGTFLPIPDMAVERLTPSENEAYERFRWFYARQWGRVDPAAIRIHIRPGAAAEKAPERIELTVDILPFARDAYAWIRAFAGASARRTIEPVQGEVFSVDFEMGAVLSGGRGSRWSRLGILDYQAPLVVEGESIQFESLVRGAPLYAVLPVLEATSEDSIRSVFLDGKRVEGETYRMNLDILGTPVWAQRRGEQLVLSTDREVAARVAGGMIFREGPAAQVRFRLEPLRATGLARPLAIQSYLRLRAASRSSAGFLSLIHRELKAPIEGCAAAARRILAQEVVCPAGGRFLASSYPAAGDPFFRSEAFLEEPASTAELLRTAERRTQGFLEVFRGLTAALSLDGMSLHSEAALLLEPAAAGTEAGAEAGAGAGAKAGAR